MIYWEEPHLVIHWDDEVKCVQMEWKGFSYGELFRTGLNKGLQLVIERKTHRWLADLRKLGIVNQEDQNWSNNDWFPRALLGGVRRMAIVVPTSELAKMSVDAIMSKVDSLQLEIAYFDDVAKAKEWVSIG